VDKIRKLMIRGLRTIDALDLDLSPLTVLIGDNGVGKSSVLEALEILRLAASPSFFDGFSCIHGGLFSLLRQGTSELTLGIETEGSPSLFYEFTLDRAGAFERVTRERLVQRAEVGSPELEIFSRDLSRLHASGRSSPVILDSSFHSKLFLGEHGELPAHPATRQARSCIAAIEVHLPFDTIPQWAARAEQRTSPLRASNLLQRTTRLERYGRNLVNVYFALKNELPRASWEQTLDYVRLGLGDRIEDILLQADPGGGALSLLVKFRYQEAPIPFSQLSDGMLSYLAFVAMVQLPAARPILAFDEPELHLHPALLLRVLQLLDEVASERSTVLLSTHSDRLLDGLRAPAEQVRVCELDPRENALRLRRLSAVALDAWLDEYRGLGALRSAGFLGATLQPEPTPGPPPGELTTALDAASLARGHEERHRSVRGLTPGWRHQLRPSSPAAPAHRGRDRRGSVGARTRHQRDPVEGQRQRDGRVQADPTALRGQR